MKIDMSNNYEHSASSTVIVDGVANILIGEHIDHDEDCYERYSISVTDTEGNEVFELVVKGDEVNIVRL